MKDNIVPTQGQEIANEQKVDKAQVNDKTDSQASKLVKLVGEKAKLFHDQHKNAHAHVDVEGHRKVMRCGSYAFRRYMVRLLYGEEGTIPNRDTISAALNLIEARAVIDGDERELFQSRSSPEWLLLVRSCR